MTQQVTWTPPPPTDFPEGTIPEWNGEQWIIKDCTIDPDLPPPDPIAACKSEAKLKLTLSDWSMLPDVSISNKQEFESYRAALRELVLNPVEIPVWPDEPQPVWI